MSHHVPQTAGVLAPEQHGYIPDKLKKAEKRIAQYPYDTEAWSVLIRDAQMRKIEDARQVYERLVSQFPNAGKYWRIYIEHELKCKNFERVEKLFQRCLVKVLSIDLWKLYLSYIKDTKDNLPTYREKMAQAYDFALDKMGMDIMSYNLWLDYINFLKAVEAVGSYAENQRITAVRKVYQRGVVNPMINIEALWKDYCAYETNINPLIAKKMTEDRGRDYMNARRVAKEYEVVTRGLNKNLASVPPQNSPEEASQVDLWKKYISWEKGNPLRTEDHALITKRVMFAYEQCLLCVGHHPDIWYEAASYLEQSSKILTEKGDQNAGKMFADEAAAIYERAITSLMKSNMLVYFAYADFEEGRMKYEKVHDIYKRLIAVNDIDPTLGYVQYMKFARRAEGIKSARLVFKMAREDARTKYQVFVAASLMEYYCSKEKTVALKIFELGLKKYGGIPEYVLCYMEFMSHLNEDNNTRVLYERVLTSGQIPPEKSIEIWSRFLAFESEVGDLASIQKVEKRRTQAIEKVQEFEGKDTALLIDRYKYLDLYPCTQMELKALGYYDLAKQRVVQLPGSEVTKVVYDEEEGKKAPEYPKPDIEQMLPFKPRQAVPNGAHPVPGGVFPPPPAAASLMTLIPPPDSFHGPFVVIDKFLEQMKNLVIPDGLPYDIDDPRQVDDIDYGGPEMAETTNNIDTDALVYIPGISNDSCSSESSMDVLYQNNDARFNPYRNLRNPYNIKNMDFWKAREIQSILERHQLERGFDKSYTDTSERENIDDSGFYEGSQTGAFEHEIIERRVYRRAFTNTSEQENIDDEYRRLFSDSTEQKNIERIHRRSFMNTFKPIQLNPNRKILSSEYDNRENILNSESLRHSKRKAFISLSPDLENEKDEPMPKQLDISRLSGHKILSNWYYDSDDDIINTAKSNASRPKHLISLNQDSEDDYNSRNLDMPRSLRQFTESPTKENEFHVKQMDVSRSREFAKSPKQTGEYDSRKSRRFTELPTKENEYDHRQLNVSKSRLLTKSVSEEKHYDSRQLHVSKSPRRFSELPKDAKEYDQSRSNVSKSLQQLTKSPYTKMKDESRLAESYDDANDISDLIHEEEDGEEIEEELCEQSSKNSDRINWREEGMPCHIPGCKTRTYINLRSYIKKHWKVVHVQYIHLKICPKCMNTFNLNVKFIQHMTKVHGFTREKVNEIIESADVKMLNPQYISPQGLLPPVLKKENSTSQENTEAGETHTESVGDIPKTIVWPKEGMSCHIPGCKTEVFKNLGLYKRHWKKIHTETCRLPFCPVCDKMENNRRDLATHLRRKHKVSMKEADKLVINSEQKTSNPAYIPTRGILPPCSASEMENENLDAVVGNEDVLVSQQTKKYIEDDTGYLKIVPQLEELVTMGPMVASTKQQCKREKRGDSSERVLLDRNFNPIYIITDRANHEPHENIKSSKNQSQETDVVIDDSKPKETVSTDSVSHGSDNEDVNVDSNVSSADRIIWPNDGMACHIPGCKTEVFKNLNVYMRRHWTKVHVKNSRLSYCPKCNRAQRNRNFLRRHLKKKHKIKKEQEVDKLMNNTEKTIPNAFYIPTHGILAPYNKPRSQQLNGEGVPFGRQGAEKCGDNVSDNPNIEARERQGSTTTGGADPKCTSDNEEVDVDSGGFVADRIVWPDEGMACHIPGCETEVYKRLRSYNAHWKRVHVSMSRLSYCPKCYRIEKNRATLKNHLRKKHHVHSKDVEKLAISAERIAPNKFYIPTLGILPPCSKSSSSQLKNPEIQVQEKDGERQEGKEKFLDEFGNESGIPQFQDQEDSVTKGSNSSIGEEVALEDLTDNDDATIEDLDNEEFIVIDELDEQNDDFDSMSTCSQQIEDDRGDNSYSNMDSNVEINKVLTDGGVLLQYEKCDDFENVNSADECVADKDRSRSEKFTRITEVQPANHESNSEDETHGDSFDPMAERIVWPEEGMACHIPGCKTDFFRNLKVYRKHWRKKHVEKIRISRCLKCKKIEFNRTHLKKHLVQKHKVCSKDAQELAIKGEEVVPNKSYIPTHGIPPPCDKKWLINKLSGTQVDENTHGENVPVNEETMDNCQVDVIENPVVVTQQQQEESIRGDKVNLTKSISVDIAPDDLSYQEDCKDENMDNLQISVDVTNTGNNSDSMATDSLQKEGVNDKGDNFGHDLSVLNVEMDHINLSGNEDVTMDKLGVAEKPSITSKELLSDDKNGTSGDDLSDQNVEIDYTNPSGKIGDTLDNAENPRSSSKELCTGSGRPCSQEIVFPDNTSEQLHVGLGKKDDELDQSCTSQDRIIWPKDGMACHVTGCKTEVFRNLRAFIKHWKRIHVEACRFVVCLFCRRQLKDRYCVKKHLSTHHKVGNKEIEKLVGDCRTKMVKNMFYIPPKGKQPPVFRSPSAYTVGNQSSSEIETKSEVVPEYEQNMNDCSVEATDELIQQEKEGFDQDMTQESTARGDNSTIEKTNEDKCLKDNDDRWQISSENTDTFPCTEVRQDACKQDGKSVYSVGKSDNSGKSTSDKVQPTVRGTEEFHFTKIGQNASAVDEKAVSSVSRSGNFDNSRAGKEQLTSRRRRGSFTEIGQDASAQYDKIVCAISKADSCGESTTARWQSTSTIKELPRQLTGEELPRQPTGEELSRQPTGEEVSRQPTGEELPRQPTCEELPRQPHMMGEQGLPRKPTGNTKEGLPRQPTGEKSPQKPTCNIAKGLPKKVTGNVKERLPRQPTGEELPGKPTDNTKEGLPCTVTDLPANSKVQCNRIVWPDKGMACHIPGCDSVVYASLNGYMYNHWKKLHTETVRLAKCPRCRKLINTRSSRASFKMHMMKMHGADKEVADHLATTCCVTVPNKNYIPPQGFLPPMPKAASQSMSVSQSEVPQMQEYEDY